MSDDEKPQEVAEVDPFANDTPQQKHVRRFLNRCMLDEHSKKYIGQELESIRDKMTQGIAGGALSVPETPQDVSKIVKEYKANLKKHEIEENLWNMHVKENILLKREAAEKMRLLNQNMP